MGAGLGEESWESEEAFVAREAFNARMEDARGSGASMQASWLEAVKGGAPSKTTVELPTPAGIVLLKVHDYFGDDARAKQEAEEAAEAALHRRPARRVSKFTARLIETFGGSPDGDAPAETLIDRLFLEPKIGGPRRSSLGATIHALWKRARAAHPLLSPPSPRPPPRVAHLVLT